MQSSRPRPDPLDPGRAGFAHRGLHDGWDVPENSLAAFEAAIEFGAGIECDLRLTADGHVVAFHDRDAARLCGKPHRISRSTLLDVSSFTVADRRIPTLQTMLELVAGRVPLLMEIKIDRNVRRLAFALERGLVGYPGRFGVMSFDPRIVRQLKARMPSALRGLVIRDRLSRVERSIALHVAAPDFLAVEHSAVGKRWVTKARQRVPVYSWTITSQAQRAQAEVHADALIWEGDGRPRI